jgi:hypothetical protein
VATDVTTSEARVGKAAPAEGEHKPRPYWRRFIIVYVVCGLAVIAGLVALIVVATGDDSKSKTAAAGPAWSKWQPKGATLNSITESIARHVSTKYENLGVSALPVSRNPVANEPPIVAVEFRSRFGTFQQPRRLALHLASRMWMYELCGQNSNCGITSGAGELPSRLNYLVGKEMLELALYTLKYAPKLDSVLIVLPGSDSSPAFYLRRQTAAQALERPVEETIPAGTDELGRTGTDLLAKRLWLLNSNQIRQLPDTSIILELDKPPAQGN